MRLELLAGQDIDARDDWAQRENEVEVRDDALVIDPVADVVETRLTREHLTRNWLAHGGTALVFLPRSN